MATHTAQKTDHLVHDQHDTEMNVSNMASLAATYTPGSPEEKALLWKIDKRIVPCIWGLYTLSYLDRANIGNAKTGGLAADFNLTSDQYSVVLLVFFVCFLHAI
jgi:hypothetical protein